MSNQHTTGLFSIFVTAIIGLLLPLDVVFAVTLDTYDLPDPVRVELSTNDLLARNCVPGTLVQTGPASEEVTYPDNYRHVIPADWVGEVQYVALFCPPDFAFSKAFVEAKSKISDQEKFIITILNYIFQVTGNVGLWILSIAGKFMGIFLNVGGFISHPYVRTGWPFIQGLANLGFLLGLLFIAASTVLRIEGWGTKLLPRLLIAALLINFSLIIGGVFIDFSRVLMALLLNFVGNTDIPSIGTNLINQSDIINSVKDATGSIYAPANYAWSIPLSLLQANIIIYAVAISFLLISVMLIARYIALILLLIFSPLAYLALAFPNLRKWGERWWSEFLKWVFYGPILLFFLVLIVSVGKGIDIAKLKDGDPVLASLLNVGFTVALLITAYKFGKSLATDSGLAALSFATKQGRRAARFAYRNPKTTAALAGTILTGGAGGALAGAAAAYGAQRGYQGIKNQAGDFKSKISKNVASAARRGTLGGTVGQTLGIAKAAKFIAGPDRNKDGTLKKGQKSMGSSAANFVSGALGLKNPQEAADANAIKAFGQIPTEEIKFTDKNGNEGSKKRLKTTNEIDKYVTPTQLGKEHIAKAWGNDNINIYVESSDNIQAINAVANNEDYLRSVKKTEDRDKLLEAIRKNQEIDNRDKGRISAKITDMFSKIDSE